MSAHRPILVHVPTGVFIAVIVLILTAAPYQYYTGTVNDVFGVIFAGFLLLWIAGYAGRELHERRLEVLESDATTASENCGTEGK